MPNTSTPLADDVSELFGIFPNSGWIYLRGTLDRETREQYDITVLASDNGTPSATATTHVIVNVLDANDNDPNFSRDSYEFSVEENVKRGTVVGIVSSTDADLGVNAVIRYSLIPSNTSFQVNPNTGKYIYCGTKIKRGAMSAPSLVSFAMTPWRRARGMGHGWHKMPGRCHNFQNLTSLNRTERLRQIDPVAEAFAL